MKEIWDKFTEFTFLKFWNQKNEQSKFSPNFTKKRDARLIIYDKLSKSTQGQELHRNNQHQQI